MSPSAFNKTTEVISVVCSMSLSEMPADVKALEERIVERVHQGGREFYAAVFRAFQQRWLEEQRAHYTGQFWREINQVTPFGLIRLPVRVVRERGRAQGGYLTLSKALLSPKATRLLSPWIEKRALEAATFSNYRPAAAELMRWLRVRVSAWLIWRCVQFHGAKLSEQLDRGWWPDRAQPLKSDVVVSEIDSTYVKAQQRGRAKDKPAAHFAIHLGLHYSGRERRYGKRGSKSVRLVNKRWILSTQPIGIFGRRLAWQRMRHFGRGGCEVLLSDGDEGLKWVREREFSESHWLLDRWHIARNVRTLCGEDQCEHRRIMAAVWKSDSEALLEALRTSPYRQTRPLEFNTLFGYILGNRDGLDNWHHIPSALRRSIGRRLAPVRSGSGAIEKNIEVRINRRFKGQGRSWTKGGAEHLAQLVWLQSHPTDWTHWWTKTALAKTKVNPGWPSCAPPSN
ncbi:MAG TPA: UPF0236 family protein [Candidatus Limnocylindrales bacterium]|nr:UPF0236 family protein [Candidatus Limnocylindrales bacterium]